MPVQWIPYCGAAPLPAELWGRWNLDPWLLGALLAAMLLWRRFAAAPGRALPFWSAVLVVLILYVSPLCALSSALFSARVVHHVALVGLLAPLILASLPPGALRPRGGLGLWTAASALVFWFWHAPPAYEWALSSDAGYWLMQASLLASALLFWAATRAASAPAAVAALLAGMVQMGLLGALLTFSVTPLYRPHLAATGAWGLSPLADQQLAGLIMWAPGALFFLLPALAVLGRWLRGGDVRMSAP